MILGIWLGIISSICFALMGYSVKGLSPLFNTGNLIFLRSFSHLFLIIPLLLYSKDNLSFKNLKFGWYRAAFGCLSLYIYFRSLSILPLGDATIIIDTSPVFVFLISIFFFKEKVPALSLVGLGAMLLGLFFLKEESTFSSNLESYLVAFLGPIALGVSFVFLKKSASSLKPTQILFCLNISLLIFSLFLGGANIEIDSLLKKYEYVVLLVASSYAAQYFLSLSFKYLKQTLASLITLLSLVWASLIDVFVLEQSLSFNKLLFYAFFVIAIFLVQFGESRKLVNKSN